MRTYSGFGEFPGRVSGEPGLSVGRRVEPSGVNLEMQVRTGRSTRRTHCGDLLPGTYDVAVAHEH